MDFLEDVKGIDQNFKIHDQKTKCWNRNLKQITFFLFCIILIFTLDIMHPLKCKKVWISPSTCTVLGFGTVALKSCNSFVQHRGALTSTDSL